VIDQNNREQLEETDESMLESEASNVWKTSNQDLKILSWDYSNQDVKHEMFEKHQIKILRFVLRFFKHLWWFHVSQVSRQILRFWVKRKKLTFEYKKLSHRTLFMRWFLYWIVQRRTVLLHNIHFI
jgi:hypothetical protein